MLEAVKDPKQLRDLINRTVADARRQLAEQGRTRVHVAPATAPQQPGLPAAAPGNSMIDQLKALGELRDAGILTEDEFAAKKADLLSRL